MYKHTFFTTSFIKIICYTLLAIAATELFLLFRSTFTTLTDRSNTQTYINKLKQLMIVNYRAQTMAKSLLVPLETRVW